ncbi:MAG: serine/threonine protein kinase, partial [Myxococcales bacterium]|nr:serine/threonine protein kinase [Myxococcales bacterium]
MACYGASMASREVAPTIEVRSPPGYDPSPIVETQAPTPVRGRRFGRFLVLGTLGSGGMGVVVEAHDEQLDRNVAIKLLHPLTARRHHARLLREAQALARLSHPNVVQVYDVGMVGEQTFIAMELVRGSTLAQWLRTPRDWRSVVALFLQAARGLAAAHDKDLVHRDFKPENCILGEDGRVRVVDFGLVREATGASQAESTVEVPADQTAHEPTDQTAHEPTDGAQVETSSSDKSGILKQRLTRAGVVLGTLAYMSLEQLQGKPADARTDQYSFCASLYEALFGVLPYDAHSAVALLTAMMSGRRKTPLESKVPRRLRRALERGLQLEPGARWPSMSALIVELEASTRRRRWWPAAALLGAGVALGGSLVQMGAEPDP